MAQKVKVTAYLKNVGRSFRYAVTDVAAEYNPVIAESLKASKETYQSVKSSMQEFKNKSISSAKDFKSSDTTIFTNTLDDLKSGNWYNKEHEDSMFDDMFSFDDEDWDWDSDDDNMSSDTEAIVDNENQNAKEIIDSMGQVGADVSKAVGYSTARSAEYIVNNANATNKALYELNASGFNQVSSLLLNLNSSVDALVQLGEPAAAYFQNSSVFFTETTESLNKINESLEILVKRTEYIEKSNNSKYAEASKKDITRIMGASGFDLSEYISMVKENVQESTDMVKSFAEMAGMMGGKNGKNMSLTQFALKAGIDALIPNITKEVSKQLNDAISNTVGNGLMRASNSAKNSNNLLLNLLGPMFLPSNDMKTKINMAKYEKGPVPWDGYSKRALTYVIPTYLAKMTALLGGGEMYYDYDKGTFKSVKTIKDQKDKIIEDAAVSAGGDFREEALKLAKNNDKAKAELGNYFRRAIEHGDDFYEIKKNMNNPKWLDKYGISPETAMILVTVMDAANSQKGYSGKTMVSNMEREVYQERTNINLKFRDMENSGMSVLNHLNDDFSILVSDKIETGNKAVTAYLEEILYAVSGKKMEYNSSSDRMITLKTDEEVKKTIDSGEMYNAKKSDNGEYSINGFTITEQEFFKYIAMPDEERKAFEDECSGKATKKMISDMKSKAGEKINEHISPDMKNVFEKVKYVWQAPFRAVTAAMDSLTGGLNDLFYGEDGIKEQLKKWLSPLWDKVKDTFSNIVGSIDKTYGEKHRVKSTLKDMGFKDATGIETAEDGSVYAVDKNGNRLGKKLTKKQLASIESAKNSQGPSLKDSIKATTQDIVASGKGLLSKVIDASGTYNKKELSSELEYNGTAYRGRKVTKSGVAIVSEGELIIPSEYNPFYHGITNKAFQAANERRIEGRYFGRYDEGGTVGDKSNFDTLKNTGKETAEFLGNAIVGGTKKLYTDVETTLVGLLMGNANIEDEKKQIVSKVKDTFEDFIGEKGAVATGAIIGTGASLLTGAVIGPIGGAAIGAGVGLLTKSQAFRDLLFGQGDPDSPEYKQGLLKDFGAMLKRRAPEAISTGVGAGIGMAAGSFMGSPLLGTIAGAGIGFVASSTKAQKFLFGDVDENGNHTKLLGKLKDEIQKRAPGIGAGALAGLLIGPFGGPIPNMIFGSAIGFVTGTQQFHDFMFGSDDDSNKDEKGNKKDRGLVGKLHDKIVNPLDSIMHNVSNGIEAFLKRLGGNATDLMKLLGNEVKKNVKNFFDNNAVGKTVKTGVNRIKDYMPEGIKKVIRGGVDFFGNGLNNIDNFTKKSNLRLGADVYNKELGRNLSAAERVKLRDEYKMKDKKHAIFGRAVDEGIDQLSEEEINSLLINKDNAKEKLQALSGKDKVGSGDVNQFIKLLQSQKSTKFSKENKADDFRDKITEKVSTGVDAILNIKEILTNAFGKNGNAKDDGELPKFGNGYDTVWNQEESGEEKSGKTTTVTTDMLGGIHKTTIDENGEVTDDMQDSQTRSAREKVDSFVNGIGQIPLIGEKLEGFSSKIADGLFGNKDDENDKGILGKLFGEDGIFSSVGGFFSKIGTVLEGILPTVLISAGTALAAMGVFDGLFSKLTGDAYNEKSSWNGTTHYGTDSEGNTIQYDYDNNGNMVDMEGNILSPGSLHNLTTEQGRKGFSDYLVQGTARGFINGQKTLAGTVLGTTGIGKMAKNNNLFKGGAAGMIDDIAAGAPRLADMIMDLGGTFTKAMRKIPVMKGLADHIDNLFIDLAEKLPAALGKDVIKEACDILGDILIVVQIVMIVLDFMSGYDDARSILGVIDNPTVPERILCGLFKAIKNLIPIIGPLVPESLVISIIADWLAPLVGIDSTELQNRRAAAKEEAEAHGKSVQDYIKQDLKDYTVTERMGNWALSNIDWGKDKVNLVKTQFSNIKEHGLIGGIQKNTEMSLDMMKSLGNAYSENGGGISGVLGVFSQALRDALPPIISELPADQLDLFALAKKGDLKGILNYQISGFSGGGENGTVKAGFMSELFSQLTLLPLKLAALPFGLVSWVGNKARDAIMGVFEKVKLFDIMNDATAKQIQYVKSGDVTGFIGSQLDDATLEGSPIAGMAKALYNAQKLTVTPVVFSSWIGQKVEEKVSDIITKGKNTIAGVQTAFASGVNMLKSGEATSISKFLDVSEITDDEDNPLGKFGKIAVQTSRIVSFPAMLLAATGKKIKDNVIDPAILTTKHIVTDLWEDDKALRQKMWAGDVLGMWNTNLKGNDNTESPLQPFVEGVNFSQKLSYTVPATIITAGRLFWEGLKDTATNIKNSVTNITRDFFALGNYAITGDFEGLWTSDMSQNDTENPISGIMGAVNFGQRLLLSPLTGTSWLGHKTFETFQGLGLAVTNGLNDVTDNYDKIESLAKDGDLSGIWNSKYEGDQDNPLNGIFGASTIAQKAIFTVPALINVAGKKVSEYLQKDDVQQDLNSFMTSIDKLSALATSEDSFDNIGSIWDEKPTLNSSLSGFLKFSLWTNKVMYTVVAAMNNLIENVKEPIKKITDKVKDFAGGVWDNATEYIQDAFSGGSSGFISQYDPRYQGYSVSGQNFASKGCGPAVASMAANAMGKNLSVGDAVRYSNGYQTSNGVTLDYFQNALGSKGINTEIIAGGSSADMYNRIASGQKVILLGRDASNRSKANSPFGPNNHYVLATGVDGRGNVIVNDPEGKAPKAYSPNILKSASYGIAGSNSGMKPRYRSKSIFKLIAGAGNPRNDATTQQIWAFLTTKLGMSPAAAAGVMGNMERESGCNPDINQVGGPAYGICQWEGGRKTALMSKPGYETLDTQLQYLAEELSNPSVVFWSKSADVIDKADGNKVYKQRKMTYEEFKQLSDVAEATVKFEAAFERAGKIYMDQRINYAKAYYEMFTGSSYEYNGGAEVSSSVGSTDANEPVGPFKILTKLTNAFSTAFGNSMLGKGSSTDGTSSYDSGTSNYTLSSSGKPGDPVSWMRSIMGKISYDMNGPRDPDKGSADCSSTVRWAIKKAGGPDIGGSTLAQLDNSNLNTVYENKGKYAGSDIAGRLRPNDVIFFSRPTSSFTNGRKYRVGHVGLYEGNGMYIDHGSGMGPREKQLQFGDAGKIVKIGRINGMAGAGSGLMNYADLALASGGSSGLLMASRAGSGSVRYMPMRSISGGASSINDMTMSMLTNVKSDVKQAASNGGISPELVTKLLSAITELLQNISDNTAPVNNIYNALVAYMQAGGDSGNKDDKVKVINNNTNISAPSNNTTVDSNISTLVGVLAELAKG